MNWRIVFFVLVPVTALLTTVLYGPVALGVYHLTEPRFGCPIKTASRNVVIRNDSFGDGDFGAKRKNGRSHDGIDLEAPIGTPVCASKSGVAFRGNVPYGYGKYVMIYHPDGCQTFYGHLVNWNIYSTQKVHKGDIVGFVGKTGNAANKNIQPHLHFEIRKFGEPQDPGKLMDISREAK